MLGLQQRTHEFALLLHSINISQIYNAGGRVQLNKWIVMFKQILFACCQQANNY
jgi:hypothetical protein